MKRTTFAVAAILLSTVVFAQGKFFTKSGRVSFYSRATLENIEAHNRSITCVLDSKTGNIQFAVQMKGFEFEKALMQEHFNENYLETSKYPRAEFKGQIVNNNDIDYTKDGTYNVKVKGRLTLHGQSNQAEADGKLTIKGGKIVAQSDFIVLLRDYKIKNDKMNNISDDIKVVVDCSLEPLKS